MDQERWNDFGRLWKKQIEADKEKFIIEECPILPPIIRDEIINLVSPLKGKKVLELGCGRGDLSVWMAHQGAEVTAVDIGEELIAGARLISEVNDVNVNFKVRDMVNLQLDQDRFDVVMGMSILHHLSEDDVIKSIDECHQVTNQESIVIFSEPVENSKIFDFIQNLIPKGKEGERYSRPSIIQRKKWAKYLETVDDRAMTNRELISASQGLFSETEILKYGFFVRLIHLVPQKHYELLYSLDSLVFKFFPFLKHFCQRVIVVYRKKIDSTDN